MKIQSQMLLFCMRAKAQLHACQPKDWAPAYVKLRMEFFRLFSNGLVCSTAHGADFFDNVLNFASGAISWSEPGTLGDNFRHIVRSRL